VVWGFTSAGIIGFVLYRTFVSSEPIVTGRGALVIDAALRQDNAVGVIANPLFRDFLIPFELTSILLLVAIIGAVLLAKRKV
jgi:NADH-quinone oxidoreductase subunit J